MSAHPFRLLAFDASAHDRGTDAAAAFYRHHGFVAWPSWILRLFLPLASIAGLDSAGQAAKPGKGGGSTQR